MTATLASQCGSALPARIGAHRVDGRLSLIALDMFSHRSMMAMDVFEASDGCRVEMDVPGVDPATIDVAVSGNTLRVTARRQRQLRSGHVEVAEREHGSFSREMLLGEMLDIENLRYACEQGVLIITVPAHLR